MFRSSSLAWTQHSTRRLMSNLPQQVDLLERYRSLVALGRIKYDENQVRVIMQLRRLQKDLNDYTPVGISSLAHWNNHSVEPNPTSRPLPWWQNTANGAPSASALTLFKGHAEELASLQSPKGLLLIGPPGSGKTFIVDLWFSALPTPYKTRKHYNQLVLELYRAVWEITQERMADSNSESSIHTSTSSTSWKRRSMALLGNLVPGLDAHQPQKYANPPMSYEVAKRLIHQHWFIVFDEIQLLDVSSASLLADVLSWFWRLGGVVVGTSNKVPEDLYKNGVQRDRLEPFVDALKARCPVVTLESESERDWRIARAGGERGTWFVLGEPAFAEAISELTGPANQGHSVQLSVFGRSLCVPWASDRICRFSFEQLCAEELGPADYLTLASTFDTLILDNVPILRLSAKDQARRFIALTDALYEARCRLVVLAQARPEDIFFPDAAEASHPFERDIMMTESIAETGDTYRPNVSSYDAPNMEEAPKEKVLPLDTLSIFSGKDEQFAFKRALSRLIEMTSPSYDREEVWTPLPLSSRRWESSSVLNSHNRNRDHSAFKSNSLPENGDFAIEASFEFVHSKSDGAERTLPREQRSAPRLREHHVWGVREDWGDGAGKWGKGAKAYADAQSRSNSEAKPSYSNERAGTDSS